MTYIPSQLAPLKLDELRRQAERERRSRQVAGASRAAVGRAGTRPERRVSFELSLFSLRRVVSQG